MFEDLVLTKSDEDVEYLPILSIEEDDDIQNTQLEDTTLPIVPLRNTVLFPGVVLPITVGREASIKAIKKAHKDKTNIGVVAQKDELVEDPNIQDLHTIGTAARIMKIIKMPDKSTTVIIQGRSRFLLEEIIHFEPYIEAKVSPLADVKPAKKNKEYQALISSMAEIAKRIIELSPNIPAEASMVLKNINSASFLTHFIASNLSVTSKEKQDILALDHLQDRAERVLGYLNTQLQMVELKNKIQSKVRDDIDKQQRDYFLSQELKKIQEELGGDSPVKEVERLREKAKKVDLSQEAVDVFEKELTRLQRTNPAAAEYSVLLNYIELILDLPWGVFTKDKFNLTRAKKVLDKGHYGLDKIKDRIIEYLAVLKLKGDLKSPILCLVGPPGVGKTSLGKSIAKAVGRKYVRMSLGGMHDEAEIRGHRKTYIGAMPGRIIQSLKKAKSSNPVFILDEIDKVGKDYKGDISSALLEVLDPEQNTNFYDNYLELDYDLSKVMFIATANSLDSIQLALRDRMEIIHVDGYSIEEKVEIAKKYLIAKQREAHGLKAKHVKLSHTLLSTLIDRYTRESGVRELDRVLASIMRSVAKHVAMEEERSPTIKTEDLDDILGPHKYERDNYENIPAGVAIGLAYTPVGGDILFIESTISKGKKGLILTGNLGDVMKESATTVVSYIKAHSYAFGIAEDILDTHSIHIHVPEGAIPKDGPSAGITILTALVSLLTNRKIKPKLAMTGEITLRGKVLPVGGIKEKILAAKRAGIKEIVLCKKNKKDVQQIEESFLKGLSFHYVDDMKAVLSIALQPSKKPDTSEKDTLDWIA